MDSEIDNQNEGRECKYNSLLTVIRFYKDNKNKNSIISQQCQQSPLFTSQQSLQSSSQFNSQLQLQLNQQESIQIFQLFPLSSFQLRYKIWQQSFQLNQLMEKYIQSNNYIQQQLILNQQLKYDQQYLNNQLQYNQQYNLENNKQTNIHQILNSFKIYTFKLFSFKSSKYQENQRKSAFLLIANEQSVILYNINNNIIEIIYNKDIDINENTQENYENEKQRNNQQNITDSFLTDDFEQQKDQQQFDEIENIQDESIINGQQQQFQKSRKLIQIIPVSFDCFVRDNINSIKDQVNNNCKIQKQENSTHIQYSEPQSQLSHTISLHFKQQYNLLQILLSHIHLSLFNQQDLIVDNSLQHQQRKSIINNQNNNFDKQQLNNIDNNYENKVKIQQNNYTINNNLRSYYEFEQQIQQLIQKNIGQITEILQQLLIEYEKQQSQSSFQSNFTEIASNYTLFHLISLNTIEDEQQLNPNSQSLFDQNINSNSSTQNTSNNLSSQIQSTQCTSQLQSQSQSIFSSQSPSLLLQPLQLTQDKQQQLCQQQESNSFPQQTQSINSQYQQQSSLSFISPNLFIFIYSDGSADLKGMQKNIINNLSQNSNENEQINLNLNYLNKSEENENECTVENQNNTMVRLNSKLITLFELNQIITKQCINNNINNINISNYKLYHNQLHSSIYQLIKNKKMNEYEKQFLINILNRSKQQKQYALKTIRRRRNKKIKYQQINNNSNLIINQENKHIIEGEEYEVDELNYDTDNELDNIIDDQYESEVEIEIQQISGQSTPRIAIKDYPMEFFIQTSEIKQQLSSLNLFGLFGYQQLEQQQQYNHPHNLNHSSSLDSILDLSQSFSQDSIPDLSQLFSLQNNNQPSITDESLPLSTSQQDIQQDSSSLSSSLNQSSSQLTFEIIKPKGLLNTLPIIQINSNKENQNQQNEFN